jgi:uncharacterized protein (TIGR00369 family)
MTTHGTITPEQMQSLTGLEFLQGMIAGALPAPPIGALMGFRLVEVEQGRAVFEGKPGPSLLNPLGAVHGGYALALVDSACGCAVHSELGAGIFYTTVETKVNFTRPIDPAGGPIRCEGRVLSRGRQIATAEAYLRSAEGKLLAHGTSTLIILGPRTSSPGPR